MATLILLAVAICTLIFWFYRKRKYEQGIFERLGLKGPPQPCSWIRGNMAEMDRKMYHVATQQWTKEYGKTYGVMRGALPMIVSSDLEFLQEVFIKKFSHFHAREAFPINPDPDTAKEVHMFMARGQRWKRLRTIIVPIFTTAKMKLMFPLVHNCIRSLENKFEQISKSDEAIDVSDYYHNLTLQVIAECGFGISCDAQEKPEDPFVRNAKLIFGQLVTKGKPWLFTLAESFPCLRRPLFFIAMEMLMPLLNDPTHVIRLQVREVLEMRKKESTTQKRVDLLQLMLDAESNPAEIHDNMLAVGDNDDTHDDMTYSTATGDRKNLQKALTAEEMEMQSLLILIAGHDTTSNMMMFCTYLLALNPDVQRKLQDEIDEKLGAEEVPTFDKIQQIEYVDMVLKEAMRIYPVGTSVQTRQCMEPCEIKGVRIDKDMLVHADVWSIHHDPKIWPDPEKFDPERFSKGKKHHPLAWIPFGAGPRNCVGMRFAQLEGKAALVCLLRKFSFETCEETQIPLQIVEPFLTITPKDGIKIKIRKRQ